MNRNPLCAAALAAMTTLVGCGSADHAGVNHIVHLVVPPGDSAPSPVGPMAEGQSLQFMWEFKTHLNPREYLAWVVGVLGRDAFRLEGGAADSAKLNRADGEGLYQVSVEIVARSPTLVQVIVVRSPERSARIWPSG
jgi:hypothetical protein